MIRIIFFLSLYLMPGLFTIVGAQCTMLIQPQDVLVPSDWGFVSMIARSSDSGSSYQWQANDGSGWTNITSTSSSYALFSKDMLWIYCGDKTNVNRNGYMYRCVVTTSCGTIISDTATITYLQAPNITHPTSITACEGDTVRMYGKVSGYNMTWRGMDTSLAHVILATPKYNVINDTLVINGVTSQMNQMYYCFVVHYATGFAGTNVSGYWSSDTVAITVKTPPTIVTQLKDTTFHGEVGSSVTMFKVAATGTNVKYQWQENDGTGWVNIPPMGLHVNNKKHYSSGTDSVFVMSFYKIDGYQFRCIVSNDCGVDTSDIATLHLQPPPITSQPASQTACVGDTVIISLTDTAGPYTYLWYEINTQGQLYPIGYVSPYTNAATSALHINGVTAAMNGYKYVCMVWKNWGGWYSDTAELTVNSAPVITIQPKDTTLEGDNGGGRMLALSATGTDLKYRWQEYTINGWESIPDFNGDYSAKRRYYTADKPYLHIAILSSQPINGTKFRCLVYNSCDTVVSDTATIYTKPSPITQHPVSVNACVGDSVMFSINTTGVGKLPAYQPYYFQWRARKNGGGVIYLSGPSYSGVYTSTLKIDSVTPAMADYKFYCMVVSVASLWWVTDSAGVILNTPPVITVQPRDSMYLCPVTDATITVATADIPVTYQWQDSTSTGWVNISNTPGVYYGANTNTLYAMSLNLGYGAKRRFRCLVSNSCGTTVSDIATMSSALMPTIISGPSGQVVCSGDTATFSVTAVNALAYQWGMKKGNALGITLSDNNIFSGTTGPVLKIIGAPDSLDGYEFYCHVNDCWWGGSATLTVNNAPAITLQPRDSMYLCPVTDATITVATADTPVTYQWQDSTSTGWVNISNTPGVYYGANANTLYAMGLNLGYGAKRRFRCVVSNSCDTTVSDVATMSSAPMPTIISGPAAESICSGDTAIFSITATNALAYQWGMKKGNALGVTLTNNGIFGGVNGPVLTITNAPDSLDGYEFYCHVNDCRWGGSAMLTVNNGPAIITHPVDDTSYCELVSTMKFAITVADTGVQYQWQINKGVGWFNIPAVHNIYQGVHTPELVISNLLISSGVIYRFRCVVTNSCGSDTSDTAKIYVTPPPTIQHTTAYPHELCLGDTVNFSIVMNGIVKSYRWEVYKNGAWPPIALTDTFPYSGVYTPNLKISGIAPVMDGDVYYCNVNECIGVPGGIIDVQQAPSFTLQPKSDTMCIYDTITTFSVNATGSGSINYQWMSISPNGTHNILTDTPIYFGSKTSTLQVTNINTSLSGMKYYCIITGGCGSDTSIIALLNIDSCGWSSPGVSSAANISKENLAIILYPNPVTGSLLRANVEGYEARKAQIRIVNRLGVVLYDKEHSVEQGIPLAIDIDSLPAGVYSLQFVDVDNRKSMAVRFVKL